MAISHKLLNEGEYVVVSTRTHPKVLIFPLLALLAALALAIVLATLGDGNETGWRILHWIGWGIFGVVLLWFLAFPLLRWATTSYTFTNRRFMKRSGLVAKEGRTIPLNRISGVDFEIGVIDRIFGCGTLVVSDASVDGRVELADIPSVEMVQLRVAEELHKLSGGGGRRADDGT